MNRRTFLTTSIGYLATKDGVVVIDSQYPDTAQRCIDGLKQKSPHAIDLLINTHHHGDHTAGNNAFKPVVTSIVAHANSALWQRKAAEQAGTQADRAYPDKTFTDAWTTKIAGETISAKYYGAGHTSGDIVVTFENANVVHMGDLMFNRFHPFVDRPAGASIVNWIKALEQVATLRNHLRGHSPPSICLPGKMFTTETQRHEVERSTRAACIAGRVLRPSNDRQATQCDRWRRLPAA